MLQEGYSVYNMADVNFFDPKTEEDVKRRRSYAQMLRKQAEPRPNEMVSGIVVKKSPWEALANVLQSGIAGYQEGKAGELETSDKARKQELLSKALGMYGQNPEEATQMLMSSPATSDLGLNLYGDKLNADRQMDMLAKRHEYNMQMTPYQQAQLGLQQQQLQMQKDNLNRGTPITAYQQAQLDLDKQKLDLQRQKLGAGYTIDENGNTVPQYSTKPMPASAIKLQNEYAEDLAFADSTRQSAENLVNAIDSGKLNLGAWSNFVSGLRNYAGASTEESAALADARTTLEKLRNDTLRLNRGVQTEGDAQRAMNQVIQSMNDPVIFKQAMQKLTAINDRAATLKKFQIDTLRQNFNVAPLDYEGLNQLPSPVYIPNPDMMNQQGVTREEMYRRNSDVTNVNPVMSGDQIGEQMVTVTNGKETYQIPQSDVSAAQKDGFSVVK